MNRAMMEALQGAEFVAAYLCGYELRFLPMLAGTCLPKWEIVDIFRVHLRPEGNGAFFHFKLGAKKLGLRTGVLDGEVRKDGSVGFHLPVPAEVGAD